MPLGYFQYSFVFTFLFYSLGDFPKFIFSTLHATRLWRSFIWDSWGSVGSHHWPLGSEQKPGCRHFMPKETDGSQLTHIVSLLPALSLNATHCSTWHSKALHLSGIPLGKPDLFYLCLPLCAKSSFLCSTKFAKPVFQKCVEISYLLLSLKPFFLFSWTYSF